MVARPRIDQVVLLPIVVQIDCSEQRLRFRDPFRQYNAVHLKFRERDSESNRAPWRLYNWLASSLDWPAGRSPTCGNNIVVTLTVTVWLLPTYLPTELFGLSPIYAPVCNNKQSLHRSI